MNYCYADMMHLLLSDLPYSFLDTKLNPPQELFLDPRGPVKQHTESTPTPTLNSLLKFIYIEVH